MKLKFAVFLLFFCGNPNWVCAQDRFIPETPSAGKSPISEAPSSVSKLPSFATSIVPEKIFTEVMEPGITLPYLKSDPKTIQYPRWAVQRDWKGELLMAVEVLSNGNVGRYQVMKSTGVKMLDESAAKAIKTWKFHPGKKNGKPAVMCIQVPVTFELEEKRK